MSDLYSNNEIREAAERLVQNEVYACVSHLVSSVFRAASSGCRELDIEYEDMMSIMESINFDEAAEAHIDDMGRQDLIDYLEDQGVDVPHTPEIEEIENERGTFWVVDGAEFGDEEAAEQCVEEISPIGKLRTLAVDTARDQGFREFCREYDVSTDDYRSEVYEHWIVSSWLRRKLAEYGEATSDDFFGLDIWGRCTTGQSMTMDSVILKIARDMMQA